MTNDFTVVGEHREDDMRLLVVGDDGHYYGYSPDRGDVSPVELDENWLINVNDELDGGDILPAAATGLD